MIRAEAKPRRFNYRKEYTDCSFCIISCGSRKFHLARRVRAQEMYYGGLFLMQLRFAQRFYKDRFFILSGKYGLLLSDQLISYYDFKLKPNSLNSEYFDLLHHQAIRLGICSFYPRQKTILVLTSSFYFSVLNRALRGCNVRLVYFYDENNMCIGYRKSKLK